MEKTASKAGTWAILPRALQALPLGRLFYWTALAPQATCALDGHSASEEGGTPYGSDSFDDEGNLRRPRTEEEESPDETDAAEELLWACCTQERKALSLRRLSLWSPQQRKKLNEDGPGFLLAHQLLSIEPCAHQPLS